MESPDINPHMYGQFMTEETRIYNGARTISSINGIRETGFLSYIIHKNQLKNGLKPWT